MAQMHLNLVLIMLQIFTATAQTQHIPVGHILPALYGSFFLSLINGAVGCLLAERVFRWRFEE